VCLRECRWAVAAAVSLKLSPHGMLTGALGRASLTAVEHGVLLAAATVPSRLSL